MKTTLAPSTTAREEYRGTARSLRSNAGIGSDDRIEAVADFGAAARRLRASVRGGSDGAVALRRPPARRARAADAVTVVDDIVVIDDRADDRADERADERADGEADEDAGARGTRSRESVVLRLIRQRAAR